jgi:hypothetical protein
MLYVILYLAFFIGLIGFFIHGVYSCYKFRKEEQKEREDFIKSLTPGSEWILQLEPKLNPFDKSSSTTIVTIVETRKNSYGDVWVQYRFEKSKGTNERQASDFQELYSKVN